VAEAHSIAADGDEFRVGAGNQVALYGERVALTAKSVNPTRREQSVN